MSKWRDFVIEQPYGTLLDWCSYIGTEKKSILIYVQEIKEIVQALSLKPVEGKYKILIMWLPEKLHIAAANKLLKILEEPPDDVIFFMVTQDEESILPTIRSRLQAIYLKPLTEKQIKRELIYGEHLNEIDAANIAHQAQGSWGKALELLGNNQKIKEFQTLFVRLVRSAFKADLPALIKWAQEVSDKNRNELNSLLVYFVQVFRQSMLNNYKVHDLVYMQLEVNSFHFDNFSKYIHGRNIPLILEELEKAIYHIEKSVNVKIVLMDMLIHITRCLHMKASLNHDVS